MSTEQKLELINKQLGMLRTCHCLLSQGHQNVNLLVLSCRRPNRDLIVISKYSLYALVYVIFFFKSFPVSQWGEEGKQKSLSTLHLREVFSAAEAKRQRFQGCAACSVSVCRQFTTPGRAKLGCLGILSTETSAGSFTKRQQLQVRSEKNNTEPSQAPLEKG